MKKKSISPRLLAILLVTIGLLILGAQLVITLELKHSAELMNLQSADVKPADIQNEKLRQEVLQIKIENQKKLLFWQTFFSVFGPTISIIVGFGGAWIAFGQFMQSKQKERFDRNSEVLNNLLTGILQENEHVIAASITGLVPYLDKDNEVFHDRIVLALTSLARRYKEKDIEEAFVNVFELALAKIPETMRAVSWQGFDISHTSIRFNKAGDKDLSGYDFRDAKLQCGIRNKIDFSGTNLEGADFRNATLFGVDFTDANLAEANLEHAKLSSAICHRTSFKRANLMNIEFTELDVKQADFDSVRLSKYDIKWDNLMSRWSIKNLPNNIRRYVEENYHPMPVGTKVVMLLTEFPPQTVGGLWTAVYHMISNLRNLGADITVLAPIKESNVINTEIFGFDVKVVSVEGKVRTSYGMPEDSSRTVKRALSSSNRNPNSYDSNQYLSTSIDSYTKLCYKKLLEMELKFDIIHAHDWVTFQTAQFLATEFNNKWIAHFHSTEMEREAIPTRFISKIERNAAANANLIIVPSQISKNKLGSVYNVAAEKIRVIPNTISKTKKFNTAFGSFDSKKVVFAGRLMWQKGPDIFIEIAKEVKSILPDTSFLIHGETNNDEYKRKLEEQAHSIELGEDVNITEVIPPNTKRNIEIHDLSAVEFSSNDQQYQFKGHFSEQTVVNISKQLFVGGFSATPVSIKLDDFTSTHRIEGIIGGTQQTYLANVSGLTLPRSRTFTYKHYAKFMGKTPWSQRSTMFDGASIVVVPSRNEPFGMIIIEAFEHGIPVIFVESAGAAEFLYKDITVPETNLVTESKNKITQLLRDESLWAATVEKQYASLAEFRGAMHEKKILDAWQELLTPPSNPQN